MTPVNSDQQNPYAWLPAVVAKGPRIVQEAFALVGVKETPGVADNPVILQWAKELGLAVYTHDSIPWCGLFMALVVRRAGVGPAPTAGPLWALAWENYGVAATPGPCFGDVLVFKRTGGGHVGLYVGEDLLAYHVLGGNQNDQVGIVRVSKLRLHEARRPKYQTCPQGVERVLVGMTGDLSQNEA